MPEMVAATLPVLVRVTVCAELVVPTLVLENGRAVGDTLSVGCAAPVPISGIVCGLPLALSVTDSAALRPPAAVGLKVILIVQLAPAARLEPQLFVCAKSPLFVPVSAMPLIERLAFPVLFSVTA